MKKILCFALAAMMTFCLLGGCSAIEESYLNDVVGTWTIKEAQEDTDITKLLEGNELYPEELALVDTPLYLVKSVTFNRDKTYSYAQPVDACKEQVKAFYDGVFKDLYEGRETLKECYETDISTLSEEDFRQFYAELYEAEDYEALLTKLADTAYNYESLGTFETGTYKITSKVIVLDAEGGEEGDGSISYKADGDYLTLTFSDATEVYRKAN